MEITIKDFKDFMHKSTIASMSAIPELGKDAKRIQVVSVVSTDHRLYSIFIVEQDLEEIKRTEYLDEAIDAFNKI